MSTESRETATLGGGCFWCLEAVYQELAGIDSIQSGYSGGQRPDPSYEQVCSGATGHAEVVQITFNPSVISYRELLQIFFSTHDPTTLNRQGGDVGTQYRSVIFYHSDSQRETAKEIVSELDGSGVLGGPVVTEISSLDVFYPAEAYHQNYYAENTSQPYCQVVINPKISKLRTRFFDKLK